MQTAHVKLFAWGGVDSQRNVDYQVERAKGGAGLLITGNRLVHPSSFTGMPRFAFGSRTMRSAWPRTCSREESWPFFAASNSTPSGPESQMRKESREASANASRVGPGSGR